MFSMGETSVECPSCNGDITSSLMRPDRPQWCFICGNHIMLYHCSKCNTDVGKCDQCHG